MSTNENIPGASKNNPRTGAKAPRKSQVKAQAGTSSAGVAVAGTAAIGAIRAAVRAAQAAVQQADQVLAPSYQVQTALGRRHSAMVPRDKEAFIPQMARLAVDHPVLLLPGIDPAEMEAEGALVTDLRQLSLALGAMQQRVDDTLRAHNGSAWRQTREIYARGQRLAPHDPVLAAALAPFQQAMKRGPRPATLSKMAAATQTRVVAATSRAAAAHQRAADAAKLAETRAAAAHAAPPAAPTPAPTPAPTAPAPSAAPSHTG